LNSMIVSRDAKIPDLRVAWTQISSPTSVQ
jgi:hypothetical protein